MRSVFLGTITLLIAWTPIRAQVVEIWPGVAPGSERWTQQERTIEGTPVGTVRSRLHYALKQLRAAVEADARFETNESTA